MSHILHQKILALPSGRGEISIADDPLDFEFKVGHLHAKTAAAELALVASEELAAARVQNEKLTAMVQEQDRMLGKKACATKECRELLAARALLREVLDKTQAYHSALECDYSFDGEDWASRVRGYLNACDTLEGK